MRDCSLMFGGIAVCSSLRAGDDLLLSSAVYDANRREDADCKYSIDIATNWLMFEVGIAN